MAFINKIKQNVNFKLMKMIPYRKSVCAFVGFDVLMLCFAGGHSYQITVLVKLVRKLQLKVISYAELQKILRLIAMASGRHTKCFRC